MTVSVNEPAVSGEQRIKISYEEYLAWPEESRQTEWVDGEMIIFMPPVTIHQKIADFFLQLLALYVKLVEQGVVISAPFEMLLHPDGRSREPDLIFIAAENLGRLTDKRLDGPADLAIEIISDESVARDRGDKFYEYQEGGVREYWIIDPRPGKERVDCYWLTPEGRYQATLPDADGRYQATVLPGFWFHPDWLRQEPLPNPLLALAEIAPQAMRAALADTLGL
ncbi:MAG: Uma2 family endonuclease [Roseiflexaceae bacterium]